MNITHLTAIPVKLQMKEPFVIASVTNYDMYYVVVKIETDEGIIGYGEATPAWEVTGETYESVMGCINLIQNSSLLGFSLLGQSINSLEEVEHLIDLMHSYETVEMIHGNTAAKAAIEQALYDAYAKWCGKPLYELYGVINNQIPFTKNISIYGVNQTLAHVAQGIEQGFETIRLKVGKPYVDGITGYGRDIEVVKRAAEMIKDSHKHIRLVADANQGFITTENAISFCKEVESCLDWLEQPILARNLMGFKKIHEQTSIPLMADESLHTFEDAELLLELGGVDYFNIKLMKTGGMRMALRIIDLAAKYGVKCQIGSMLESSIGAMMGCQSYFLRSNIISTDLNSYALLKKNIASGLEIAHNHVVVSSIPGCSGNFREQNITCYTF